MTGPHLVVMQYYETPPADGFDRAEREAELASMELELQLSVTDWCGQVAQATRQVRLEFAEDGDPGADSGR